MWTGNQTESFTLLNSEKGHLYHNYEYIPNEKCPQECTKYTFRQKTIQYADLEGKDKRNNATKSGGAD